MARRASSRGRARGRARGGTRGTRQSRRLNTGDGGVPDVFQDMLAETDAPAEEEVTERPRKKRRTAEEGLDLSPQATASPSPSNASVATSPRANAGAQEMDQGPTPAPRLQTVTEDSDESDDNSDMEWEDVALDKPLESVLKQPETLSGTGDLSIVLNGGADDGAPTRRSRRKGITSEEKRMRLDVHKVHVLCLLYHAYVRNAWCNDRQLQTCLKRFLTKRMVSGFTPNPDFSQPQAARAFMDALNQAKEAWSNFRITKLGLKRARWSPNEVLERYKLVEDLDPPIGLSELQKAAVAFEGSADTGAQLFCAFLRAAGVEARLVCSLQPLPFTAAAQPPAPSSPYANKNTIYANSSNHVESPSTPDTDSTPAAPRRIRRLGQSSVNSASPVLKGAAPPSIYRKPISPPRFPIYWVEAFNIAQQKWIAVDPISTTSVGKPYKLEPPLNSLEAGMAYVIAYEKTGVAKDVTRRYASSYNAKTQKFRVETSENGARWWRKAMKIFGRETVLDRDQVEDAELSKREVAEPMPTNVQDFKNHPYYALERHLRHNEVIHPKREVGKVNAGTAAVNKLEPIYRRRDVHACKSADRWYRLGRVVRAGEQPLKHARPRRNPERELEVDEHHHGLEEQIGAGLYAPFQTELYVPPPVVDGRVPRNAFGNIDVYVPSMVPGGAAHIQSPDTARAARLLNIDYADAVTGFQFKGRQGTAIVQGAVVAAEYHDAVEEVIRGFVTVKDEEEARRRSREALRMWRRFLTGLRIVERVKGYATEAEQKDMREELDKAEDEEASAMAAGGFFPDAAEDTAPTAESASNDPTVESDGCGGGFLPDTDLAGGFVADDGDGGGFIPDDPSAQTETPASGHGDGFLPDALSDVVDGGAGFLTDEPRPQDTPGPPPQEDDGAVLGGTAATQIPAPATLKQETTMDSTYSLFHEAAAQEPDGPIFPLPRSIVRAEEGMPSPIRDRNQTEPQEDTAEGDSSRLEGNNQSQNTNENEEAASSSDEKGSLPSHDPEDEDAEPEWLLTSD
ncbi:Rad4-domain-containing protein [Saccharata proteae CBS 121410]|uniref:Rad4-domain-containing protein n=1 Tax=Saccharata proteae CBS 121410 TaxID=1314787 RepID=A0A9P4I129_9PEZI|nr:Rad4-domain-containing protein [Saccharata proteae CBS 121410]